MKWFLGLSALGATAMAASLVAWSAAPSRASYSQDQLREMGAKIAADLALACPHTPTRDAASFKACERALSKFIAIPLASVVLWGGDQGNLPIKNRKLTRFSSDVFRSTYMPLMSFTGRYTIDRDQRDNLDVIRVEAYFRNDMPAGEYPYPFWHSSDKWNAYEAMNRMSFYLNDAGKITVITRGDEGSDANRGPYSRVTPPAFVAGEWTWTDPHGQQQPRVMLFSSRYSAKNPHLAKLDETYRAFAVSMRDGSCVACHNPANSPGARQLVLLQTPWHAAGEIERVIKAVGAETMPLDEVGLPAELGPGKREEILRTAKAFRDQLVAANKWEASQRQPSAASANSPAPTIPTRSRQ